MSYFLTRAVHRAGTHFCKCTVAILLVAVTVLSFSSSSPVMAQDTGPFTNLAGWWGGEGRLRFKDGKQEQVKCRATYFVEGTGQQLKQTVRCASGGGKIELTSEVNHDAGKLSGIWKEAIYNLDGAIDGEVTARGFRVTVKGSDTAPYANMEILVKDGKQIVEIQFFSDTLVGLTLILKKGEASPR